MNKEFRCSKCNSDKVSLLQGPYFTVFNLDESPDGIRLGKVDNMQLAMDIFENYAFDVTQYLVCNTCRNMEEVIISEDLDGKLSCTTITRGPAASGIIYCPVCGSDIVQYNDGTWECLSPQCNTCSSELEDVMLGGAILD